MPRGMGNSGVASREIQASNLPDLSAAVRTSQQTQQNIADQQKASLSALAIANMRGRGGGGGGGSKSSGDGGLKPFVVGKNQAGQFHGGGYTVAVPDGKGSFTLKTIHSQDAGHSSQNTDASNRGREILKQLGIDTNKDYASLGVSGMSGKYSSGDLIARLMKHSSGTTDSGTGIQLRDIIKQIQSYGGGGSSSGNTGGKFSVSPNADDVAWEAGKNAEKEREIQMSIDRAVKKSQADKLSSDWNAYKAKTSLAKAQLPVASAAKSYSSPQVSLSGALSGGLMGLFRGRK